MAIVICSMYFCFRVRIFGAKEGIVRNILPLYKITIGIENAIQPRLLIIQKNLFTLRVIIGLIFVCKVRKDIRLLQ